MFNIQERVIFLGENNKYVYFVRSLKNKCQRTEVWDENRKVEQDLTTKYLVFQARKFGTESVNVIKVHSTEEI